MSRITKEHDRNVPLVRNLRKMRCGSANFDDERTDAAELLDVTRMHIRKDQNILPDDAGHVADAAFQRAPEQDDRAVRPGDSGS